MLMLLFLQDDFDRLDGLTVYSFLFFCRHILSTRPNCVKRKQNKDHQLGFLLGSMNLLTSCYECLDLSHWVNWPIDGVAHLEFTLNQVKVSLGYGIEGFELLNCSHYYQEMQVTFVR